MVDFQDRYITIRTEKEKKKTTITPLNLEKKSTKLPQRRYTQRWPQVYEIKLCIACQELQVTTTSHTSRMGMYHKEHKQSVLA